MDAARLALLEQLFDEGLKLPAEQRPEFCRQRCGDDVSLYQQLLAMLQDASVEPDTDEAMTRWDTTPRSRIGRYRILRTIGRGGMGSVYEALEPEPLARRVALKILRVDLGSSSAVDRFHTECKLLARLEHPGIPRVLDAGTIETGRPWFSMELVRGVSLAEFLRDDAESFDERVRLFFELCDAIQHAHAQSTLHLDLKPSNVLVQRDDEGVPRVKVIDFGIGRDSSMREARPPIGSVDYMSPEQAAIDGVVDERTDVYGLAVLLHEMLAGVRAFERVAGPNPDPDFVELVRGSQRDPLSVRRGELLGARPEQVEAVEFVLARAMSVDPDERPASVAKLRQAIRASVRNPGSRAVPRSRMPAALALLGTVLLVTLLVPWFREAPESGTSDVQAATREPIVDVLWGLARLSWTELQGAVEIERIRELGERLDSIALDPDNELVLRSTFGELLERGGSPFAANAHLLRARECLRTVGGDVREARLRVFRTLAATQGPTNRRDLDPFSLWTLLLPAIGAVDDQLARTLSTLANATHSHVAGRASAELVRMLERSRLDERTARWVADGLALAHRHHRGLAVIDPAPLARAEIALRRAFAEPRDPDLVMAYTRLLDALLVDSGDESDAEVDAITTALAQAIESGHARDWRVAAARLHVDFGRRAATEAMVDDLLPVGAAPCGDSTLRRIRTLERDGVRVPDELRVAYARHLCAATEQPRSWRLRAPAVHGRFESVHRTFARFDERRLQRSTELDGPLRAEVAAMLEHAEREVPDSSIEAAVVAAQLASWCRLDHVLTPDARIDLAAAAVVWATRAQAHAPDVLRRALAEHARALLYAQRPAEAAEVAEQAVRLGVERGVVHMESLYPRSLLVEARLASGVDAHAAALALARDARATLHDRHPFRRYTRTLAVDRAGVEASAIDG